MRPVVDHSSAFAAWQNRIGEDEPMLREMIIADTPWTEIAHRFGLHYRTARRRLFRALAIWCDLTALNRRLDSATAKAA